MHSRPLLSNKKALLRSQRARRGGVLVLTLIVVLIVGAMAGAFLQLNSAATRRQAQAVDNKLAFYVAEAGLTEGFLSLLAGENGGIGTEDEPAEFANGLIWVEAEDLGSGFTRLTSNGTSHKGRVQLAAVFQSEEPSPAQYGIYAGETITLPAGSIVDGFDSSAVPTASGSGGWSGASSSAPYAADGDVSFGRIRSNGSITVASRSGTPSTIHADLEAGPDGSVEVSKLADFPGTGSNASETVTLDPVVLPSIPREPGASLLSGMTTTIDPGVFGFGPVVVGDSTTLKLTGPLDILFESLTLHDGAELIIDDRQGRVRVYIEDEVILKDGSIYSQLASSTAGFELHIAGSGLSKLKAEGSLFGLVYSPRGTVKLGSAFHLAGALVADMLEFGGAPTIHYDHGLVNGSALNRLPKMVSWTILEMSGMSREEVLAIASRGTEPEQLSKAAAARSLQLRYVAQDGTSKSYSGALKKFSEWKDVLVIESITESGADIARKDLEKVRAYGSLLRSESEKGMLRLLRTLYGLDQAAGTATAASAATAAAAPEASATSSSAYGSGSGSMLTGIATLLASGALDGLLANLGMDEEAIADFTTGADGWVQKVLTGTWSKYPEAQKWGELPSGYSPDADY